MDPQFEINLRRASTNEEIRLLCERNPEYVATLEESLKQPKELMEYVFRNLMLKDKHFHIFEPSSNLNVELLSKRLTDAFDDGILNLNLKSKFTQVKFPKLFAFYEKHCVCRAYYFHIFKCIDEECELHGPLISAEIQKLGEPVPVEGEDGVQHYEMGEDSDEKFLPSKQLRTTNRGHGIPFTPTAQTCLNVGITISCIECKKPRLFYAKYKLKCNELVSLKRILNDIRYVCGTVLRDIEDDERNKDTSVSKDVYLRENLECGSNIEIPYYSCKIFKIVCISCGKGDNMRPCDDLHYPQCNACTSELVKRNKRKQVLGCDLNGKKRQKTLV